MGLPLLIGEGRLTLAPNTAVASRKLLFFSTLPLPLIPTLSLSLPLLLPLLVVLVLMLVLVLVLVLVLSVPDTRLSEGAEAGTGTTA